MSKKKKTQKNKKQRSKRSQAKYPALNPKYTTKVRKEFHDIDYIDQLSDEPKLQPDGSYMSEKEWMNKFMEEHLNASFKNNEKDLIKDSEKKKKVYNENNSRNRDLYNISKVNGLLQDRIEDSEAIIDSKSVENAHSYEEAMIKLLDVKKKKN